MGGRDEPEAEEEDAPAPAPAPAPLMAPWAAAREGVRLAEAQHAEIQAQRRELMVKLANTEIKAPAAGVISRRIRRW